MYNNFQCSCLLYDILLLSKNPACVCLVHFVFYDCFSTVERLYLIPQYLSKQNDKF